MLVVIKNPQPQRPRRSYKVNQRQLAAHVIRPRRIHLPRKRLQMPQKLLALLSQSLVVKRRRLRLKLQEPVKRRHDPAPEEIDPDAHARALIQVAREQALAVVWVGFFEELENHVAFEERLAVVLEGRDEPARIQLQEGLGLVVGVYFDVLVGDLLFFEDGPDALDEGAEPAAVEFEGLGSCVCLDDGGCSAGGAGVEVRVGVAWVFCCCCHLVLFCRSDRQKSDTEGEEVSIQSDGFDGLSGLVALMPLFAA